MHWTFHSLLASALLAACTPVAVPDHRVTHEPTLAFEDAVVQTVTTREFPLHNSGAAEVTVQLSVDPPFSVSSDAVRVGAQSTEPAIIGFLPGDYTDVQGTLTLTIDGASTQVTMVGTVSTDADQDGHTASGAGGSDCNDLDDSVHPDADEYCDGVDEDCDEAIDESALDVIEYWLDADNDGYGTGAPASACAMPTGHAGQDGDCDDAVTSTNPGASETFYDGVDSDCANDSDFDADGDGYDSDQHGGTDCADLDVGVHPDAVDTPYDGIDSDCGGNSDFDADGDGSDSDAFGGADCDDADSNRSPLLTEVDDDIDQDCDVLVDEDFVNRGDWEITEVHFQPAASSTGSWLELMNIGATARSLAGHRLSAEDGNEVLGPIWVNPDQRVVLCEDTDTNTNGGVTCDGLSPRLDGSWVEFYQKNTVMDELDARSWTLTAGTSVEHGTGLGPDADASTDWCAATQAYGDGDLGTPAAAASCTP